MREKGAWVGLSWAGPFYLELSERLSELAILFIKTSVFTFSEPKLCFKNPWVFMIIADTSWVFVDSTRVLIGLGLRWNSSCLI